MAYEGVVRGGVVVLVGGADLPEGARVTVIPATEPSQARGGATELGEWLRESRALRGLIPMGSDSTELLRQIRADRAAR